MGAQRKNNPANAATFDLNTYDLGFVVQGMQDSVYNIAFVVGGPDRYERRVLTQPTFTERIPNMFYGIVEVDESTIELDNLDGSLTFLAAEAATGRPVRARVFDQTSQEFSEVRQGTLNRMTIGRTVQATISSHDTSVLSTPLPRKVVGVTGTTQDGEIVADPEDQPDLVTSQFPNAPDSGVPINIVFGRTQVKLAYCNKDDVNSHYDYLVGEGTLDVENVYRISGNEIFKKVRYVRQVEKVYTEFQIGAAGPGRGTYISFADWSPNEDDPADHTQPIMADFWQGTWMHPLTGVDRGVYSRISQHLKGSSPYSTPEAPRLASLILIPEGSNVAPGDLIELQEWEVLANTVYKGRTAIRFAVPQDIDTGATLIADVARYQPIRKNRLFATDGFDPNMPTVDTPYTHRRYWYMQGFTAVLDGATIWGPDDVSQTTLLTQEGAAAGSLDQTVAATPGATDSMTFSLWVRAGYTFSVQLFGNGAGGTASQSTYAIAPGGPETNLWRRCYVTKTSGWGTGTTTVTCRYMVENSYGLGGSRVWGAQLEDGDEVTYYEPVGGDDQGGKLWSFPDAVGEILQNPTWGYGQVVNGIEAANRALAVGKDDTEWLFLKCQGSIPDLSGNTRTGYDVLNELLQIRGLRLRKDSAAWKLEVDVPGFTPQQIFGTEETPYANAFNEGPIESLNQQETPRALVIGYGQEYGKFSSQESRPYYPLVMKQTLPNTQSELDKIYSLQFVRDSNTAARFLQYLAATTQLAATAGPLEVGDEGRLLRAGHVLSFISPPTQPENRLLYSNDLTQTAWVKSNATVLAKEGRDPYNRNWTASKVTFSAAGSVSQVTGIIADSQLVIGYAWLRADTPTDITLSLEAGAETESITTPVGQGYHRVLLNHQFASGVTESVTFKLASSGAAAIYVWGTQVVLDYFKDTTTTTDTIITPITTFRAHGVNRTDIDLMTLDVVAYDSDQLFTYVKPPFPQKRSATYPVDPRIIAPNSVTDVTIPDFTVANSAAFGTEQVGGVTYAWVDVTFRMPLANVERVLVQLRRSGEVSWLDVTTYPIYQYGYGVVTAVHLDKLLPGQDYELRFTSFNVHGRTDLPIPFYFTTP